MWLHVPSVKRGRSPKFHLSWQGRYRLVTNLFDVTYRIQATGLGGKRKCLVVHFNRLKSYTRHLEQAVADHDQIGGNGLNNGSPGTTEDDFERVRAAPGQAPGNNNSGNTEDRDETDDDSDDPPVGPIRRQATPPTLTTRRTEIKRTTILMTHQSVPRHRTMKQIQR